MKIKLLLITGGFFFALAIAYIYLGSYKVYKAKIKNIEYLYRVNRFSGETYYTAGDGVWRIVKETDDQTKIKEQPIPDSLHKKLKITNVDFSDFDDSDFIKCEIINHTSYIVTRIDFRFELYDFYDADSRLRNLYDKVGKVYDLGDFSTFVTQVSKPEKLLIFYDAVSKDINIGKLSDLKRDVEQFNKSGKTLVLARRISHDMTLEPTLSVNMTEQINSFNTGNIYLLTIENVYGYIKNN